MMAQTLNGQATTEFEVRNGLSKDSACQYGESSMCVGGDIEGKGAASEHIKTKLFVAGKRG